MAKGIVSTRLSRAQSETRVKVYLRSYRALKVYSLVVSTRKKPMNSNNGVTHDFLHSNQPPSRERRVWRSEFSALGQGVRNIKSSGTTHNAAPHRDPDGLDRA